MNSLNTSSPKVLVISSSPFSTQNNNGKTLSSFFAGYPTDQIAQFCFSGGDCNAEVCYRYFFLTNDDVIKHRCGKSYSPSEISSRMDIKHKKATFFRQVFHLFSQARFPIAILLKNLIWSKANYSKALEWIQDFNPSVVFFQGFSMAYGYEFTLKVCNTLKVPLILELTDDYTHQLHPLSPLSQLNHHQYMRLFKQALLRAKKTIVISEMMKKEYESLYGGEMDVLINCVNIHISQDNSQDQRTSGDYVYAGNLLLNRWRVLLALGKALAKFDKNATLSIYTPDIPPRHILHRLSSVSSIRYCGTLSKGALEQRLATCEYVVHVEAFDRNNRKITRLSLSTKISEYLVSGAKILAIGPPEVASMRTLAENDLACCITHPSEKAIISALQAYQAPIDRKSKAINFLEQYAASSNLNLTQLITSICDI